MKRNKKRLIQLVIVLLLVFGIIVIKNQLPQLLTQKPPQPFSTLKKEQVTQILITKERVTSIYKKDGLWYVKKNNREYRADGGRVNKIIDGLIDLSKGEVVSANKDKHKELGLDKQKIEVKTDGKSYVIYVGDITGISKNYIRIDEENEVFAAEGFEEVFTSDDYRDLLIHFVNDETKVTSIEINFDDKKTSLNKDGEDWKIGKKTAKKDRVDFLLNDLKTLKADDLLPKETNIPDIIPFTIKIKEGSQEKSIEFFPQEENTYLAKTPSSEYIFQIPAAYVASLKKEEKDFID